MGILIDNIGFFVNEKTRTTWRTRYESPIDIILKNFLHKYLIALYYILLIYGGCFTARRHRLLERLQKWPPFFFLVKITRRKKRVF